MRHRRARYLLSRTADHREMLLSNMAIALIKHKRIHTTQVKAKALSIMLEKLVTKAKDGDLHSRRLVARQLRSPEAVKALFEELAPRYGRRNGGYTRIMLTKQRRGDAAQMCLMEFVGFEKELSEKEEKTKKAKSERRAKREEERKKMEAEMDEEERVQEEEEEEREKRMEREVRSKKEERKGFFFRRRKRQDEGGPGKKGG
jgi:large subunit ribosomal protein L17